MAKTMEQNCSFDYQQEEALSSSNNEMFSCSLEIVNERGLHARAAAMFVKETEKYKSSVIVEKGEQKVCGRSIMGLMMLAASKGSYINITAIGEQAKETLKALTELVNNGFYEDR